MKKLIHHLRRQSEQTRRHMLHVLVIMCAVVLVILWIFSLGRNITNPETKIKLGQDLAPFGTLKANTIDGYQIISGQASPVLQ